MWTLCTRKFFPKCLAKVGKVGFSQPKHVYNLYIITAVDVVQIFMPLSISVRQFKKGLGHTLKHNCFRSIKRNSNKENM